MHFNSPSLFAVDDLEAALESAPRRLVEPLFQPRPKILPCLDPFELGVMAVSKKPRKMERDGRLLLALLQRRRKRRHKHQFQDAAEESRIRKKKKQVISFLDCEKPYDCSITKAMHRASNEETAKPKSTGNKGPRDNFFAEKSTLLTQSYPSNNRHVDDAAELTATTEDATARSVTLAVHAADAVNTSADDMQFIKERFAASHVGEPRKNCIQNESLFADAVDEVLAEDDDSMGSSKSKSGALAKDNMPPWVSEQRETTTQRYNPQRKSTDTVRNFQPIPVGYETLATFHSERLKPPLGVAQFFQLPALATSMAKLSDFHQLLLQHCEMVKNTGFRSRSNKVASNQLGMRCRFCALKGIQLNQYPGGLDVIHLTFYKIGIKHLAGVGTKEGFVCPNIPNELRCKLQALHPMVIRQTTERGGFSIFQFFKRVASVCSIVQTRQGIKFSSDVSADELMDAPPPVKRPTGKSFGQLSIKQAAGKKTTDGSTETVEETPVEDTRKHQNKRTASKSNAKREAVCARGSEEDDRVYKHAVKKTSRRDTTVDGTSVDEESPTSADCFGTSAATSQLAAKRAGDSQQDSEEAAKKVVDAVVEHLSSNSDDSSFEAVEPAEGAAKNEAQHFAIQATQESNTLEERDDDSIELLDSNDASPSKQIWCSSDFEIFIKQTQAMGAPTAKNPGEKEERKYQNKAVLKVNVCDISDSSEDGEEDMAIYGVMSVSRKESPRRASIEVMDDESSNAMRVEILDSNVATKADKGMDSVAQSSSEHAGIPCVIKVKARAKSGHKSDHRSECMSTFFDERMKLGSLSLETNLQGSSRRVAKANSIVVPRSPSEGDNHTGGHFEILVTDASDSEGSTFTYKAESQVGQCERICKDAKMAEEIATFETQNNTSKRAPYSLTKFLNLWKMAESRGLGFTAKEVEKSKDFRRANHNVEKSDSDEQGQAQYGRILPKAMQKVFHDVMGLQPDSIFVDLGHGIGNTCLQAAFTVGCHSKGIELVDARYFASEAFNRCLAKAANIRRERRPHLWNHRAGLIELRHGRLENPAYHKWLTGRVHHVFVNNFADVFGERSAPKKTTITVDSRISAMFATMKPGSVMVTMHPMDALGLTRDTVLDHRQKHNLKTPHTSHAAFFELEKIELGPANKTVSWSANGTCDHTIWVYKYTRLEQANEHDDSVFLCTNHRCERAREAEAIPATINGENGLIMNACDCNFQAIRTRGR